MNHTARVSTSAATDEPAPGDGSARRRELLAAAYAWVVRHGWAGMSLRPLAEAIGSSPRVLLFLFGSKHGLIRELLARSRADQLEVLDGLRPDTPGADTLAQVGRRVWAWLADPEHRNLLRLWLEAYSRSVGDEPGGPWSDFAARTVHDWDELLAAHQDPRGRDTADGTAERALLLAVLRGALLDLLATDDRARLDAAVHRHLDGLTSDRA